MHDGCSDAAADLLAVASAHHAGFYTTVLPELMHASKCSQRKAAILPTAAIAAGLQQWL